MAIEKEPAIRTIINERDRLAKETKDALAKIEIPKNRRQNALRRLVIGEGIPVEDVRKELYDTFAHLEDAIDKEEPFMYRQTEKWRKKAEEEGKDPSTYTALRTAAYLNPDLLA